MWPQKRTRVGIKEVPDLEQLRLEQEAKRLELMERQIALQEKQAASMQTQVERTAPKDNPNYQPRGIYNPQGLPESERLALKCEIFDGPIKLNRTPLTPAEIEQLNRLEPIEMAQIIKMDRSVVKASVRATHDASGRLSRLEITRPMGKDDNPQLFPPLDEMAKQLADQAAAVIA
jgi:hypothetical protein